LSLFFFIFFLSFFFFFFFLGQLSSLSAVPFSSSTYPSSRFKYSYVFYRPPLPTLRLQYETQFKSPFLFSCSSYLKALLSIIFSDILIIPMSFNRSLLRHLSFRETLHILIMLFSSCHPMHISDFHWPR
jgi:hypothetical protein